MDAASQLHRLLWLSRPLMQRVEAMVRDGIEGTGLTVRMRAVLEILHHNEPLTVPDIAHALHIQRQYAQLMINEVLEGELAEKQSNPRHRTSPLIALSETGRAMIQNVLAAEHETAAALAERFRDDDIATALRVTEQLLQDIGARNDQ